MKNERGLVWDIIKIPVGSSKLYGFLILLQRIIGGIIPSLSIIAVAKFIDTSIKVMNKSADTSSIYMPIFFIAFLIGVKWISSKLSELAFTKLQCGLRANFRLRVTKKVASLEYRHIENKDTWDLIMRVTKDMEKKLSEAFSSLLGLVEILLSAVGILVILTSQIWWAGIAVGLLSVPLAGIALKSGKVNYDANREASEYERKADYFKDVLMGREESSERTLFGYSKKMSKVYYEEYEKSRKIVQKSVSKRFIIMKSTSVITSIISLLMIMILIPSTVRGDMSIGMFMSITNGMFSLIASSSWMMTHYLKELAKNKEKMRDIRNLMALKETEDAFVKPKEEPFILETVEFKDVTFSYPNTDVRILDGMTFKIEKGKNYAFVGGNGAGKTTVTKLLTGLYTEYDGEILVNGKDIRTLSQGELKGIFSVVYQDFAKYFITVGENIALGDINSMKDDTVDKKIEEALNIMNLKEDIERLPKGLDTPLGKILEGGQDISGGQWQRLAMARTLVNNAPLRILDEPTAALDPISESRIYEEFNKIGKGATTIFISHRLGSTKLAQEIFVLGDGKVQEKGTHQELLDRKGIYTEMYESQRSWYDA